MVKELIFPFHSFSFELRPNISGVLGNKSVHMPQLSKSVRKLALRNLLRL